MSEDKFLNQITLGIENELKKQVSKVNRKGTEPFYEMISYHMGWRNDSSQIGTGGKRLRPVLLSLITHSSGGKWQDALPAAAAIELIHNFSLIHDDIEDRSDFRRGRLTVWKKWGIAQGINTGDGLFALADLSLHELTKYFSHQLVIEASNIMHNSCFFLTRGQFKDLWYENANEMTLNKYWLMIADKTAALLKASTEIGALLGSSDPQKRLAYRDFGYYLGLAFQAQDDFLGIWGDPATTGKSTGSDLIARKKSLPILFGIMKKGAFAQKIKRDITQSDISSLSSLLSDEGADVFTKKQCQKMFDRAEASLNNARPAGISRNILYELLGSIYCRES